MFRSKTILLITAFACWVAYLPACKSKSSTKPKHTVGTNTNPTTSSNAEKVITLGSHPSGEVVEVSSFDLNSLGGIDIVVMGIPAGQLILGIVSGPTDVKIQRQGDSNKLIGNLPINVSQANTVVILARDRASCSASDCNILPDANGRFAPNQVSPNSASDVQGTFNIQLTGLNPNIGTSTSIDSNINNGTTGPGSWFGQFFKDPMGAFKTAAGSVYDFFKNIFK